jgi:hypothetical protein
MDLRALSEMMDRLVEADPYSFADEESIQILHQQRARFDSVVTRASAAFDSSDRWALEGARTCADWLATRLRIPKRYARRQLRRGRELRDLPSCERAWSEGKITADHVDAISQLRRKSTEDALVRDEQMLVSQAVTLRYESFVRALDYWKQLADPDGTEEDELGRRDRREVYLDASFGGMWMGEITLDPISGTIVADELARLERQMFEADWAQARSELGREPTTADLSRTFAQRRADALVEMAIRSKTAPADGRRPSPLFTVLVGYETMHGRICELVNGTVLSPGALVPWLDEAYIERAVFGPGRRVEISPTARLFTGATRRAVELRDRECTHPYCEIPARDCEVDHVVPFSEGGATIQENGRILCDFHNRLRNQRPPP